MDTYQLITNSQQLLGDHLIVPCDDEVVLNLFSYTSDYSQLNSTYWGVQHSFWLPEWGVKEDLVPGLEGGTVMWFLPDDPGTFNIRCAEYCGLDHSKMVGYVDVVSPYNEELENTRTVMLIPASRRRRCELMRTRTIALLSHSTDFTSDGSRSLMLHRRYRCLQGDNGCSCHGGPFQIL